MNPLPLNKKLSGKKSGKYYIESMLSHDFLSLAFRSFFLLACISSIISLIVWVSFLSGITSIGLYTMNPIVWHVHEMIFGFAATVAVGFLLTAVQTWTKLPSLSKGWIVLLITLWCVVRIGLYINSPFSLVLSITAQLAWWLIVLNVFIRLLIQSKNKRNYIIAPILSVIALLNMAMISNPLLLESVSLTLHIARTAVLVFVILMGLIGGRVIPLFTTSGTKVSISKVPSWLTLLVSVVSVICVAFYFVSYFFELSFTPAIIMIICGVVHLWRFSFWKTLKTIGIPLLWSLHLSYFLMAIGLILLGLSYFTTALMFSDSLHMITIGAIGLMIFSMMSRVSLGHTGRALSPSIWVNAIYILLAISAFIRVVFASIHLNSSAWLISAICWIVASSIFLVIYSPILWRNKPSD